MKKVLLLGSIIFLVSCDLKNQNEDPQVNAKLDSLQLVADNYRYSVVLLDQIGMYMDSIDENRKWIVQDLETGLTEEDYITRMKSIHLYTQKAEWTIGELEKTRQGYMSQVKRLKKQIEQKDEEIKALQFTVVEYQMKNTELQNNLIVSQEEVMRSQMEVEDLNVELNQADSEIKGMMEKLRSTEAEKFYALGESMELMASRIEFAPKRKNETLQEALKNYEQAAKLGYESAGVKVKSLKEKLDIEQ